MRLDYTFMQAKKRRILVWLVVVALLALSLLVPASAKDPTSAVSTQNSRAAAPESFEREVLGLRIEFVAASHAYRLVQPASGERNNSYVVLSSGTLEECEERLLEVLRDRYGTGHVNVPIFTTGGLQFWGDVFVFQGWRIQKHVFAGHYRLLDGNSVRRAWGEYEGCRVAFEEQRVELKLKRKSDHLVLLVHGLGRSRHSFSSMHESLVAEGYEVSSVGYPSTRRSLAEHVAQLTGVLERADGIRQVSFVTHSLGGIVVRKLLSTPGSWQDSIALHSVVMLAPPNRGSVLAEVLEDWVPFQVIAGDVGQELTPAALVTLPEPSCSFGIIAGGTGKEYGYNPVLKGDNDGVVLVANTRLPGANDFLRLNASHSFIMHKQQVIDATLRFLRTGRFAESDDQTSISPADGQ